MSSKRCIIIGDGVGGLSTTLYLLEKGGDSVTLLSHRQAQAASNDFSKIVRIDYADESRMEEAISAQECWKNDEPFKASYQPVGRIVMYDEANIPTLNGIESARSKLGQEHDVRLPFCEARTTGQR